MARYASGRHFRKNNKSNARAVAHKPYACSSNTVAPAVAKMIDTSVSPTQNFHASYSVFSRMSILTKPATLQQSCALRFHHRGTTPPPNFFQPARRIGYWPEKWLTAKCSRLLPSLVKLSSHSSSELSNLIEWVCRSICPPLYVPRFFLVFSCQKPLQQDR